MIFGNSMKYLGLDLGNSRVRISASKEMLLEEPTIVSLDVRTKEVIYFGQEAYELIGKTNENIISLSPMKDSVISDFELATEMLYRMLKQVKENSLFSSPRIVVSVPVGITDIERRAVEDAVLETGAKEVLLLESPICAYLGLSASKKMETVFFADLGDGCMEASVLHQGEIVASKKSLAAGKMMNQYIRDLAEVEHEMLISEDAAEGVKNALGDFRLNSEVRKLLVRGRDIDNGMPKISEFDSVTVSEAMGKALSPMIDTIRFVLEQMPPEMSAEIFDTGITLIGGLANIPGIAREIARNIYLPIHIAKNPQYLIANGTGIAASRFQEFK